MTRAAKPNLSRELFVGQIFGNQLVNRLKNLIQNTESTISREDLRNISFLVNNLSKNHIEYFLSYIEKVWKKDKSTLKFLTEELTNLNFDTEVTIWGKAADYEPGHGEMTQVYASLLLKSAEICAKNEDLHTALRYLLELKYLGERAGNYEWLYHGLPLLAKIYFSVGNEAMAFDLYCRFSKSRNLNYNNDVKIFKVCRINEYHNDDMNIVTSNIETQDVVPEFMKRIDFRRIVENTDTFVGIVTLNSATVLAASSHGSRCQFVLTSSHILFTDELNFHPRYYVGQDGSFIKAVSPERTALVDLSNYKKFRFIKGRHLLLGGAPNYYHWLFEYLPRLRKIKEENISFDTLIVNCGFESFQSKTLEIIFKKRPDLTTVDLETQCKFEELIVPTLVPVRESIKFLRETFLKKDEAGTETKNSGHRIFISRLDAAAHRVRISDEESVFACLKKYGFQRLILSELSFENQVEIFKNAQIVVGAHGAGLTNIVFCPEECKVVEINNPTNQIYTFFEVIADEIGMKFVRLICDGRSIGEYAEDDAADVDVAKLSHLIEEMI